MGAILGKPKAAPIAAPQPQAAPPTIEDASLKAQQEADILRRRKGRAAALLSGADQPAAKTATKTLLGE